METFAKTVKVARIVEIFKIWHFIIFDDEAIIYLKCWLIEVEKDNF